MAPSSCPLPLELFPSIGCYLSTRDLSILSRACRSLHTFLAKQLDRRFAAEIPLIIPWAAQNDRAELIERAFAIDAITPDISGRIIVDVVELNKINTLQVLLSHGVNPDPIRGIETLLFAAVRKGHLRAARLLLESGADVHRPSGIFPITPITFAMYLASGGHGQARAKISAEMVELLNEFRAVESNISLSDVFR